MNPLNHWRGALAALSLAGLAGLSQAQEIYIPIISNGFQHQF